MLINKQWFSGREWKCIKFHIQQRGVADRKRGRARLPLPELQTVAFLIHFTDGFLDRGYFTKQSVECTPSVLLNNMQSSLSQKRMLAYSIHSPTWFCLYKLGLFDIKLVCLISTEGTVTPCIKLWYLPIFRSLQKIPNSYPVPGRIVASYTHAL